MRRRAVVIFGVGLTLALLSPPVWAQAVEVVGGWASTTLHPTSTQNDSLEFVARSAATFGLRAEVPTASRAVLVAVEARLVPRGGGVSFRQTYGYFGDYLELSLRPTLRRAGRATWSLGVGPAVSVRLRSRTGYSLYHGPDGENPDFGPLVGTDLAAVAAAGLRVRTGARGTFSMQMQYTLGLTNLHDPGHPGDRHDPHVFDFLARGRTLSVVLGLGLVVGRNP